MRLCVSTPRRNVLPNDFSILRKGSNFGDELNFYIWPELISQNIESWILKNDRESFNDLSKGDTVLFCLGSILQDLPNFNGRKVIFGAGYGWGVAPNIDQSWRCMFVRGPITAAILGVDSSAECCDGAYALRLVSEWENTPAYNPNGPTLVLAHANNRLFKSISWPKNRNYIDVDGIRFIDTKGDPLAILSHIASAGLVLSEAMHGAILADCLRVPWIPVSIGEPVGELKWHDWCASMELNYRPNIIIRSWRKEGAATKLKMHNPFGVKGLLATISKKIQCIPPESAQLSDDKVFYRKIDFIRGMVHLLSK